MAESIDVRVYFAVALYPEGTFDSDNWDNDEYDFAEDREEKFNTYLVSDDRVPYIITCLLEGCNWNKESDEYMTKISYNGYGTFVAELHFNDLDQEDIDDSFVISQIIRTNIWPGE
jgi:hypothetical protein